MEKLTEAGTLYLKDYQILTEARKEVDRYLNSVIDNAFSMIKSDDHNFNMDGFQVGFWNNESSKGNMEISFTYKRDSATFKKNKPNLNISYKDIRHETRIPPTACRIYLWSSVDSRLKEKFSPLSIKILGKDIYHPTILELDLNNSMQAAEYVKEKIVSIYDDLAVLVNEVKD